jgi:hypothetical protein
MVKPEGLRLTFHVQELPLITAALLAAVAAAVALVLS